MAGNIDIRTPTPEEATVNTADTTDTTDTADAATWGFPQEVKACCSGGCNGQCDYSFGCGQDGDCQREFFSSPSFPSLLSSHLRFPPKWKLTSGNSLLRLLLLVLVLDQGLSTAFFPRRSTGSKPWVVDSDSSDLGNAWGFLSAGLRFEGTKPIWWRLWIAFSFFECMNE
jgi:hypothetical protein